MYITVYGRGARTCCVLLLACLDYICSLSQSDNYDVVKNSKITPGCDNTTMLTASKALYCAISCLKTGWCLSASYHQPTGECELTRVWASVSSGQTTQAAGWSTLYRTGMIPWPRDRLEYIRIFAWTVFIIQLSG
jgi:hypothetical protein